MRAQFVETVIKPYGNAAEPPMVPIGGLDVSVYEVNPDGTEGGAATTYLNRTDSVAGPTSTDDSGTVAFYLEPGDYNIHFDDPQEVPRIASFVRGFAAITNNNVTLTGSTSGDLKLSLAVDDHGNSLGLEGIFDWIRLDGGIDGSGRLLLASEYGDLWRALGSPTLDGSGKFRLPNPSAHALVAAGAATGLTTRALLATGGTEKDSRQFTIPDITLHHNALAIKSRLTLENHQHDLSETYGRALFGRLLSGRDLHIGFIPSGEFDAGSMRDLAYEDTSGGWVWHPTDVHTYQAAALDGQTNPGGAAFYDLSGTSGEGDGSGALSIGTSSRTSGDWKTAAQDVDKMQPWIAFTVFMKANG